jgi:hypothetical protein
MVELFGSFLEVGLVLLDDDADEEAHDYDALLLNRVRLELARRNHDRAYW